MVVDFFTWFGFKGLAKERGFLLRVVEKARVADLGQLEVRQLALLVYLASAICLSTGFGAGSEIAY